MTREAFDELARRQDEYIANHDMIQIDGWIGNDPTLRTRARLLMEKRYANIAGMQQKLYFARDDDDDEPEVRVIYTPGLPASGYPDDRIIAVDLDHNVTRVLNSDYFGESKKGGLRMWNNIVFEKGGLALHAGLKVDPDGDRRQGLHDHRAVRHREDHDDVHDAERVEADPGRLRGPDAGRCRLRDRERVLREDATPSIPSSSRPSTERSPSRPRTSRTCTRMTRGR